MSILVLAGTFFLGIAHAEQRTTAIGDLKIAASIVLGLVCVNLVLTVIPPAQLIIFSFIAAVPVAILWVELVRFPALQPPSAHGAITLMFSGALGLANLPNAPSTERSILLTRRFSSGRTVLSDRTASVAIGSIDLDLTQSRPSPSTVTIRIWIGYARLQVPSEWNLVAAHASRSVRLRETGVPRNVPEHCTVSLVLEGSLGVLDVVRR